MSYMSICNSVPDLRKDALHPYAGCLEGCETQTSFARLSPFSSSNFVAVEVRTCEDPQCSVPLLSGCPLPMLGRGGANSIGLGIHSAYTSVKRIRSSFIWPCGLHSVSCEHGRDCVTHGVGHLEGRCCPIESLAKAVQIIGGIARRP